jgi:hypothetical protein
MADRRWDCVIAQTKLGEAFAHEGVHRVGYVSAFPDRDQCAVWLGTNTDSEVSQLRVPDLSVRVAAVLADAGFLGPDLAGLPVITQSEETVDRDYDGNWFYALR